MCIIHKARELNCEGSVACPLSLTVFVTEVDNNITVIQPDLRKLNLFLPILFITEKKMYLVYLACTTNLKFFNSTKLLYKKVGGG